MDHKLIGTEKLTILKNLREFIIPLSDEELFQLERNLVAEGCREPLIVWQKSAEELVLVDGHNRYKICQKHGIPFKIKKVAFGDIEEVKIWMVENQMGRRNLTPDQMSYYRGLRYLSLKKRKGGYGNVKSKGQNELSTAEQLSAQFNTSESTIKRDAKFAEGLNAIGKSNPKLKTKILTGEAKVKKGDVQTLADAKDPDSLIIKNEADLYNKAKIIRDSILDEVERKVKKMDKDRIERAQEVLKSKDPVFLNKEDRIKRIKGMIISAINRAIMESDANAIRDLKKLIDILQREIFD